MEFITEYGLLIAVATPVGVLAAINVLLAFGGERGTLLFPSLRGYPPVITATPVAQPAPAPEVLAPMPPRSARPSAAQFDEADELLARHAA